MVQSLCCLDLSVDFDLILRALGELAHGLLGNFLAQLLSCHRRTETTHMHQYVSFYVGSKDQTHIADFCCNCTYLLSHRQDLFTIERGRDVKGR